MPQFLILEARTKLLSTQCKNAEIMELNAVSYPDESVLKPLDRRGKEYF